MLLVMILYVIGVCGGTSENIPLLHLKKILRQAEAMGYNKPIRFDLKIFTASLCLKVTNDYR